MAKVRFDGLIVDVSTKPTKDGEPETSVKLKIGGLPSNIVEIIRMVGKTANVYISTFQLDMDIERAGPLPADAEVAKARTAVERPDADTQPVPAEGYDHLHTAPQGVLIWYRYQAGTDSERWVAPTHRGELMLVLDRDHFGGGRLGWAFVPTEGGMESVGRSGIEPGSPKGYETAMQQAEQRAVAIWGLAADTDLLSRPEPAALAVDEPTEGEPRAEAAAPEAESVEPSTADHSDGAFDELMDATKRAQAMGYLPKAPRKTSKSRRPRKTKPEHGVAA